MPFVKGQSGNPAGRPPGARNRKTLIAEALFEAHAEEIVRCVIERALMGEVASLRMCIGVLMPRSTERPVPFLLPAITSAKDVEQAAVAITAAVGTGDLTPREAFELLRLVDRSMKIIEAARAAQQAAAEEAELADQAAGQIDEPTEPAAAIGSQRGDQAAQRTTKYNEPAKSTAGAAEPIKQQPEITTKYNERDPDRRDADLKRAA
jgi:hypothetical protein